MILYEHSYKKTLAVLQYFNVNTHGVFLLISVVGEIALTS